MKSIKAYFKNIELYPIDGLAHEILKDILHKLEHINFEFKVLHKDSNQGQMSSNLDAKFQEAILVRGGSTEDFAPPAEIHQKLDFSFRYRDKLIAVEIEKTNQEKILRDILKCHMYLHYGADFSLIALPKNYPHRHGIWNLYEFGVNRFDECRVYGFGVEDRLSRILLLGYEQFDMETGLSIDADWRNHIRNRL